MPIDRCRQRRRGHAVPHQASRSSRRRANHGRACFRVVAPRRQQHQSCQPRARALERRARDDGAVLVRARRTSSLRRRDRPGRAGRAAVAAGRSAAAASSRGAGRPNRSTGCRRSAGAAFFALFDCRWPMRCHLLSISAVSAIFCRPSWTLFSPKSRWPAAQAARTRSAPNVLETATSVTAPGSRPDRARRPRCRRGLQPRCSAIGIDGTAG